MSPSQHQAISRDRIDVPHREPAARLRSRLLSTLPVIERFLDIGGVTTAVLEGGEGAPLLLLHGPGGHAASWMRVIPELVRRYRIVVPDLPGQGATEARDGYDEAQSVAWLAELIERTCSMAPAVVGHALGGAIAARLASRAGAPLRTLVLVDALGLARFAPTEAFGYALEKFVTHPIDATHEQLWRQCAFDLDSIRAAMGMRWAWFTAYNLDRARSAALASLQHRLMQRMGLAAIPEADLARIAVPTTLIWGRHDRATAVQVAEAASARYGWPLHVIEHCGDDPPIEQPDAFVKVLDTALEVYPAGFRATHGSATL